MTPMLQRDIKHKDTFQNVSLISLLKMLTNVLKLPDLKHAIQMLSARAYRTLLSMCLWVCKTTFRCSEGLSEGLGSH